MHELTVDALFWLVETSNKAQVRSLASQACDLLPVENPADECRLKYRTLARPSLQALVTPHFGSKYPDEVKERHLRSRIVLRDLRTLSASREQLDSLVETSDVTFALTLAVFRVPVRLQACGASFFIAPGRALEILVQHYTSASEMPQLPSRIWDALYATSLWRVPSCSPYTSVTRPFLRLLQDAVGSHVHTLAAPQHQTTISDKPIAFNRYMQSHLIEAGWLCRNGVIVNMHTMVRPLVRRLPGSDDAFDDPCDDVQDDGLSIHALYPGESGVKSAANTYKHLPSITSIATTRGLHCQERTIAGSDAQGDLGSMTIHDGGGLHQHPSSEGVAPLKLPKSLSIGELYAALCTLCESPLPRCGLLPLRRPYSHGGRQKMQK
ncbi:hypothetical protein CYLTODRAFT_410803 [Cylindrobasidium torrendii FP15055 ss-10]|uniref:Uncharacterized protein n=1 Tax=Cylindrobasidium torrendii FP15055 ss-10 TaxID=1314674 RepID=A0A0D7BBM4_9AGAR|nr:hypothetical protein CYLTODRAFT_410803 [Cylindrobasidium torrendii FP15055 ss-10]